MTDPREAAWIAAHKAAAAMPIGSTSKAVNRAGINAAIDAFLTASLSQEDNGLVERVLAALARQNLTFAESSLAEEWADCLRLCADRITVLSAALAEAERERDEARTAYQQVDENVAAELCRRLAAESALRAAKTRWAHCKYEPRP